jgi:hypothetical protein
MTIRTWMLGAVALAGGAVAEGAAPEISHRPVACVPADRYARIAIDAPDAARAELQFRTGAAGGWYSARMAREDGRWVGYLPRASRGVARYEYRVVATAADATSRETAPVAIAVVEGACDAESRTDVATPIVVTVPAGAPLVPPVPAGLSPAGVVAAEEKRGVSRTVKIAGAAAIVAVGAAVAAGTASSTSEPEPEPFRPPSFSFNGTRPNPGSAISLSEGSLVVMVRMSEEPSVPFTFVWTVDLLGPGGACARMRDVFRDAQRPLALELTAIIVNNGVCGPSFEVTALRIVVDYQGAAAYDETLALPFRVIP